MAKVINKIGAITYLKSELRKRNIHRFSSIKDIQEFQAAYRHKISNIDNDIRNSLDSELNIVAEKYKNACKQSELKRMEIELEIDEKKKSKKEKKSHSKKKKKKKRARR